MSVKRNIGGLVLSAFSATLAVPAHSQGAAGQGAEGGGALEEITVTARKRQESLQDVPIAVTAFSEAALQSIGVRNLEDIALRTPGVQFNEQAGQIPGRFNCSIRFRGMNVNTEQPVAQLGALFIDGIFVASGCNSLGAEDLQRVEVVKGPQAVYFGRNTFGGAINYVTKDPGNEWRGKATASFAEGEDYEYSGAIEGPLVEDKLSFRVTGRYFDRGNVFGRANDGGELGAQKTRSVAAKVVFTPTDSFKVKLRGQYAEDRDGAPGSGFISGRLNDTCTGTRGPNGEVRRAYICGDLPGVGAARSANANNNIFSYNTLLTFNSLPNRPNFLQTQLLANGANDPAIADAIGLDFFGLKRNNLFVGATADWDLPNGWTLSGVAGHNQMRSNWLRDFDLTEAEAWASTDPQNLEDDTYELRLTSGQDQPLTWVVGVSRYKMEYTQSGNGGTVVTSTVAGGVRVPLTFNNSLVNNVIQNYSAAFGGLTWKFADAWSVSAEARYQQDEIEKGQIIAAQTGRSPASAEWTDVLPRVILQWQPNEGTNVYASYSKGVLPGDINAEFVFGPDNMRTPEQLASAQAQIRAGAAPYAGLPGVGLTGTPGVPEAAEFIDREELDSFEIGWKQQWMEGRLQTNAAIYFMKWKNQKGRVAVNIVDFNGNTNSPFVQDPASCPQNVARLATDPICNDTVRSLQITVPGTSELQGLELESTYLVTDRLTLQLGLDYVANEYTDFTFNFVEPLAGTRDMRGNSSPRYPEWKGNVALNYSAPIGGSGWEWFTRGDLMYFGEYFIDESNLATAPAQTLLSARIGFARDNLRVELFGNNLLDEDAYASAARWTDFTTPAVASTANQGVAVAPQRPRFFGVKFSYDF